MAFAAPYSIEILTDGAFAAFETYVFYKGVMKDVVYLWTHSCGGKLKLPQRLVNIWKEVRVMKKVLIINACMQPTAILGRDCDERFPGD